MVDNACSMLMPNEGTLESVYQNNIQDQINFTLNLIDFQKIL